MPDRSSEGLEIKTVTLRGKEFTIVAAGSDYTTYEGPGLTADDNYHTFEELYEHRYALFLALCELLFKTNYRTDAPVVWCSKLHSDGTMFDGWFIAGIGLRRGKQMTYHLPLRLWDEAINWCLVREHAPEYDGHTSQDVLERLKKL